MSGISIIIVNYNVKYFIRQCLQSIYASDYEGNLEVIVVDNDSVDGSQEMIRQSFPDVRLVDNKENLGFAKANNQGLQMAVQPYTLILNPDTILKEDTLRLCHDFITKNQEVGMLGVKMVDGSGKYLPESKRGFPTPLSALFKLTGISKLFPHSRFFNSYYQGHLKETETNEIEVLTGAFMFSKTELLQDVGGFDEDYFMYGEDIELSRQIYDRGKKIFYFPQTQIIHFKGESTKKLSASYIKNFYGAMSIYAKKRNSSSSVIWIAILNVGIVLSALAGIINKLTNKIIRPLVDAMLLFLFTVGAKSFWARFYFEDPGYFRDASSGYIFFTLVLIVVLCYFIFGQYDKRQDLKHLLYGFGVSSLGVLSIYSLFPSQLRFSRLILLLTVLVAPLLFYFTRRLFNYITSGTSKFNSDEGKRVAIVGTQSSYNKISEIVTKFSGKESLVGRIALQDSSTTIGVLENLEDITESRRINELIFCSSDMKIEDIFSSMAVLGNSVNYKLANNNNTTILGSSSKERVGEWYALDISFKIDQPFHRRTKRILDLLFCFLTVALLPIVLLFAQRRSEIFSNVMSVLIGNKTWIGYNEADQRLTELPVIKTGVFVSGHRENENQATVHQNNLWYARNYNTWNELAGIITKFFGRSEVR